MVSSMAAKAGLAARLFFALRPAVSGEAARMLNLSGRVGADTVVLLDSI